MFKITLILVRINKTGNFQNFFFQIFIKINLTTFVEHQNNNIKRNTNIMERIRAH